VAWISIEAPALTQPGNREKIRVVGVPGLVHWQCDQLGMMDLVLACPTSLQIALFTNASDVQLPAVGEGRYRITATVGTGTAVHVMVIRRSAVAAWARVYPCKHHLRAGEELRAQALVRGTSASAMWLLVEPDTEQEWQSEATEHQGPVQLDRIRAVVDGELVLDVFSGVFPGAEFVEGARLAPMLVYGSQAAVARLRAQVVAEVAKEGRRSKAQLEGDGLWFFPAPDLSIVNRIPKGGVLTVSPVVGEALKTPFHISTIGWQDEDPDNLWYEFYVLLDQGPAAASALTKQELKGMVKSSAARRLLPRSHVKRVDPWMAPGGHHLIIAHVQDEHGADALVVGEVVVEHASAQQLLQRAVPALQLAEGSNSGFAILEAVLAVLAVGQPQGDLVPALGRALSRVVQIAEPCEELAIGVGTANRVIVGAIRNPEDLLVAIASVEGTIEGLIRTGYTLPPGPAGVLLETVGVLAGRASPVTGPDFGGRVQATVGALGRCLLTDLEPGESVALSSAHLELRAYRGVAGNDTVGRLRVSPADGRRLEGACRAWDVLEILWPRDVDPVRLRRRAIAGDVAAYQFFCDGTPAPVRGSMTVVLPVRAALLNTNFQYQCLVSEMEKPEEHVVVPATVVADGAVACEVPAVSAGWSVSAREALAPPAEGTLGSAPEYQGDAVAMVDELKLETPPIPRETQQTQLPIAIIVTCCTILAVAMAVFCMCARSSWVSTRARSLRHSMLSVGVRPHLKLPEPTDEKKGSLVEFGATAASPKPKGGFVELIEAKVDKPKDVADQATGSHGGSNSSRLYSALDEAGAGKPVGDCGSNLSASASASIDIVFEEDPTSRPRVGTWDDPDMEENAAQIQPVSAGGVSEASGAFGMASMVAAALPTPDDDHLSDDATDDSDEVTEEIFLE